MSFQHLDQFSNYFLWIGDLLIDFQDVVFLLSQASFSTTLRKNVAEMIVSGPLHVLKLWLGVSRGMRPVKYVCCNKASLRQ